MGSSIFTPERHKFFRYPRDISLVKFGPELPGVEFTRGDANADGVFDFADAVFALQYLFVDGEEPSCMDAADSNDDEKVDVADAAMILARLFAGADRLPDPFGECGYDTTQSLNKLRCASFAACP